MFEISEETKKQLEKNEEHIDGMEDARRADEELRLSLAMAAAKASADGLALWRQFGEAYANTDLGASVSRDIAAFDRTMKKFKAELEAAAKAKAAQDEAEALKKIEQEAS